MMDFQQSNTVTEINPAPVQEPVQKPKKDRFAPGFIAGLCIGLAVAAVGISIFASKLNLYKRSAGELLDPAVMQKLSVISDVIDGNFYNYMEEDYTLEDKREWLYRGLIASTNDKYAQYFTAEELKEELEENQGIYYGVGAYITFDEELNYPVFSGIMEDTPAEAAGLHAGDVIVQVDETSAYGMNSSDTANIVRGPEGTVVHLTIFREGEDDYLEFDVTRAKVESQTVKYEMLEDDIGYIAISNFEIATVDQFTNAYQTLRSGGAKGLILDLRGNPGGLTVSVTEIARQILPAGLIYYEEFPDGTRQEYSCDGSNEIDIPLVVLINDYSASASEILTGAIRDHGVGTIMGTKSYGKGIVQNTLGLSDGSAVKVTVSAYYSPNGINIQGKGIEPDIVVEFDADAYYDKDIDNQREAAAKEIKRQLKEK